MILAVNDQPVGGMTTKKVHALMQQGLSCTIRVEKRLVAVQPLSNRAEEAFVSGTLVRNLAKYVFNTQGAVASDKK